MPFEKIICLNFHKKVLKWEFAHLNDYLLNGKSNLQSLTGFDQQIGYFKIDITAGYSVR